MRNRMNSGPDKRYPPHEWVQMSGEYLRKTGNYVGAILARDQAAMQIIKGPQGKRGVFGKRVSDGQPADCIKGQFSIAARWQRSEQKLRVKRGCKHSSDARLMREAA